MVAKTIEGVFALILVILANVALQAYSPRASVSSPTLGLVAKNALISLDSVGQLAPLVVQGYQTGNWTHLSSAVAAALPGGITYQLRIVKSDAPSTSLPGTPLANGALQGNTATATYMVSNFDRDASEVFVFYLTLTISQVG